MCRIALAPCSPFSVTRELMAETAEFARARGVRLHTHMAETVEEEAFCLELFGVRPVEYLEELGWLGDDVWLAHCVHLDEREIARFGETGHGRRALPVVERPARRGDRAGRCRCVRAGAPVGLGVDGAASNEAGELGGELRQALLLARLRGGPAAMTAREALELGTLHGARCLGPRRRARHARGRASSPTSCCGGSTTSTTRASTTRSRRWCSARARSPTRSSSTARSWSATASC